MNPFLINLQTSTPCPKCGSPLTRTTTVMSGPYSGRLTCPCGFSRGTMEFIGRSILNVQPLPEGALAIYQNDPDVVGMLTQPGEPE